MKDIQDILKIAGAYVGVIVGAGFASGQEILQFFTSFGIVGLVGSVISGMAFVLLSLILSTLGKQLKADSHKPVVQAICGRYLGWFVDVLITFFMFAITAVMLAGAGSLLEQQLGLPAIYGSILVTVLTVAIVCLNVHKVIALIGAVTPLLVLMAIIVSAYTLLGKHADMDTLQAAAQKQPQGSSNWLLAALLYVSYNILAGAPFLAIMGGQAVSRRSAMWGGIAGGVLLGVLMLMIAASMYVRVDGLQGVSMPMLLLATEISPWLGHLMSLVIFLMILNTAVGMLYAFTARLAPHDTPRFRGFAAIAALLAFAGSFIGFISMVGTVYPFFGYLGFLLMACTLLALPRLRGQGRIAGATA